MPRILDRVDRWLAREGGIKLADQLLSQILERTDRRLNARSDNRLVRNKEVRHMLGGIGNPTLYRLMHDHGFPKQIKIGTNRVAWSEAEVVEWIEEKKRKRARQ